MKLTLCTGKTNSDANSVAFNQIKSLVFSGEKIFVVVPDRASLITELSVFSELNVSGVFNLQVVSINKLASLVLGSEQNVLSSFGGSLLVKKILNDNKQNLVCFNKMSSSMNFAGELYRTIQQFKSSNILPSELLNCKNLPNRVKLKLQDINLIWENYEKEINENFADGFSRLKEFKEKVKSSELISSANFVFLYGDNYTNEMLSIVCEIISHAKQSFFALPKPDQNQNNENVYSNETLNLVMNFASNFNISTQQICSNKTSAIKEKLLSFTLGEKKQQTENVFLFESKNEVEEAQNICAYILSQVKNGARFDDFNLVLADDKLQKPFERALKLNQIPHFFDREFVIANHALSKLILSLINCFCFDFQSSAVLELVKNYFFGFEVEQLSDFENYVFKRSVEGAMFFSQFSSEGAEQVRNSLNIIFDYYKNFKKEKDAGNLIELIKIIISQLQVEEKLEKLSASLEKLGDFENSKISLQVLEKINEVLNDIELIFKNKEISTSEFREIVLNGLSKKTISLVPIKTNCVYVGSLASSFFAPNKTNIVVGASFGSFPANIKDVGIISDDEINLFNFKNKLEPSIKQLNEKAMLKALEICADANKLVVSFSKEVNGENRSESLIATDLKNIFDVKTQTFVRDESIISNFEKNCILSRTEDEGSLPSLSPSQFNDNEIAITSLEKYFECPLKFTLTTKIKIKERESGAVQAFDIGNIYHEFMFKFMKICSSVNDRNLSSVASKIIDEVLSDKKYEILTENSKNNLIIKNIKKESLRLAQIALLHENAGKFKANKNLLEVSFGDGQKLKPVVIQAKNKNYFLRGKIDRVDTFGDMARVIDYKTGSDKFNFADIYYGKKIQLISYLSCLNENGFNSVGAYYFPLTNSYQGKNFIPKLDGITLKDQQVVRFLDEKLDCGEKSQFLSVALTKDGQFSKSVGVSTLLSQKEMESVKNYVKELSKNATEEISSGFCAPWPLQKSENLCSCDYCPFKNSYYCLNAKMRSMKSVSKNTFTGKEEE